MFEHVNIHTTSPFRLRATIWLITLLSAGCASQPPSRTVAIIDRGEHLIATHGSGESQPSTSRRTSVNSSKQHLLEIYNGQQKIIERIEARQRQKEEHRLGEASDFADIAEGAAAPLPDDISATELLRILEKQQSLIQALGSSSRN